jgi:hypothetical protein
MLIAAGYCQHFVGGPFAARESRVTSSQGIAGGGHLEKDAMPLFKYFLTVGSILTAGLFALSAYLEPRTSDAAARVSAAPTTASLYFAPAPSKPANATASLYVAPSPSKPAKTTKH